MLLLVDHGHVGLHVDRLVVLLVGRRWVGGAACSLHRLPLSLCCGPRLCRGQSAIVRGTSGARPPAGRVRALGGPPGSRLCCPRHVAAGAAWPLLPVPR